MSVSDCEQELRTLFHHFINRIYRLRLNQASISKFLKDIDLVKILPLSFNIRNCVSC